MEPRYVLKWNNGYWKVFDTKLFKDVERFALKSKAKAWTPA